MRLGIGFYEDHLVVHYMQGGADVAIAYPQVAKVFETKNLFFLMLSTRIGFLLEKQGFEGTTADALGRFIRARAVGEGRTDLKKGKRKDCAHYSSRTFGLICSRLFGAGDREHHPENFYIRQLFHKAHKSL